MVEQTNTPVLGCRVGVSFVVDSVLLHPWVASPGEEAGTTHAVRPRAILPGCFLTALGVGDEPSEIDAGVEG